jgi:hypothetical protein
MENVHNSWCERGQTIIDQTKEKTFSLFVRQVKAEALLDLGKNSLRISRRVVGEVFYAGLTHQMEQVQHQTGTLTKGIECLARKRAKLSVFTRIETSETIHHLF